MIHYNSFDMSQGNDMKQQMMPCSPSSDVKGRYPPTLKHWYAVLDLSRQFLRIMRKDLELIKSIYEQVKQGQIHPMAS